jgi:hypothetical protein
MQRTPIRCALRITRKAISPRFAIKIPSNMQASYVRFHANVRFYAKLTKYKFDHARCACAYVTF